MIEKCGQNLLAGALAGLIGIPAFAETIGAPEWHYEGAEGAEHWGDLAPEFASCAIGREQSPIDLTGGVLADLQPIEMNWNGAANWSVVNNGHTIQGNSENAGFITISGVQYVLKQFHFHTPSEHAIDGQRFAMEVHFVHAAADGNLAVLGVMMTVGGSNTLFHNIMAKAPSISAAVDFGAADLLELLPKEGGVFRYQGSLTTPPCLEIVNWTVFNTPITVDAQDIAAFQAIFPANARPIQPVGRRFILSE
jgi:carbonic anhydrase